MTVREILNSKFLYVAVGTGVITTIILCIISFRHASKRALEIGFTKEDIKKIVKSSCVFSIIPSIAIVVGVISLSSVLGVPWSWFRLSVVGSLLYELTAAGMVTSAAGYDSLAGFIDSSDVDLIPTIFLVMSISILAGIVSNFFFGKKYQGSLRTFKEGNDEWGSLVMSYATLALMAVLTPAQIFKGLVPTLTLVTSGLFAFLQMVIVKKYNVKWLQEFILAFSLIFGMMSAVLWESLLL